MTATGSGPGARAGAVPDAAPDTTPDIAASAAGTPDGVVPKGTTPTYELEMLISGAVTVGLLQLPRAMDATMGALLGQVSGGLTVSVITAWLMGKAALYALVGAFLVHLALRAYWVGLVGLDSVFPQGIRWNALRSMGPITRAEYQRRMRPLPAVITQLDNVASTIFSLAFMLVVLVAFAGVGAVGTGLVVWGLGRSLDAPRAMRGAVLAMLALGGTMILLSLLDRVVGARLAPRSWLARFLAWVVRWNARLSLAGTWGPILLTLQSNVRRPLATPLMMVALFAAFGLGVLDTLRHLQLLGVATSDYFPLAASPRSVAAGDYDTQRSEAEGAGRLSPSIQSDVIEGPYVRLFVPLRPEVDDPALRRSCPDARPLATGGVRVVPRRARERDTLALDRVLGCLARLRTVTLDGGAVPGLAYRFHRHPATGVPGLLAYIPTDSLARGPHMLRVASSPAVDGTTRPPAEIPFWR